MKNHEYLILFFCILVAGTASAFLPPDASAREPQIRAYRQQVREKYEERKAARYEHAVQAYEQTRADIFTPPWMRDQTKVAVTLETGADSAVQQKADQRKHRFLVSVVLLMLLGAGAGWARYATRQIDK